MNQNQYDKLGIVDFLNTMKQPSGFSNRKALYQSLFQNIPVNYTGTVEQNTELANALRDTYKQVGSNLGQRPRGDALKEFARKIIARSVSEGNRPTERQEHPMAALENTNTSNQALMGYLFGTPNTRVQNNLSNL
jgi:hypothetical protein